MKYSQIIKISVIGLHLFFVLMLVFSTHTSAQLCNGNLGAAVFEENFGAGGAFGPPLSGSTDYAYIQGWPQDGQYSIAAQSLPANAGVVGWHEVPDHTPGDNQGHMLVVNASFEPGEFYQTQVAGLCDGTVYEFAAWVGNVNNQDVFNICGNNPVLPNVTFQVHDTQGNLLGEVSSGNIPVSETFEWLQFGLAFQTNGFTQVEVRMVNNAPGGCGNDLVIDDITFRPCGSELSYETNLPSNSTPCFNDVLAFTFDPPMSDFAYFIETSTDGGMSWTTGPIETTLNTNIVITDTLSYRIVWANSLDQLNNPNCRYVTATETIAPYTFPTFTATTVPACEAVGGSLTLSTDTTPNAFAYAWSDGSNGAEATGLAVGEHTVTITHLGLGCSQTLSYTMDSFDGVQLVGQTSPACAGTAPQGSIQLEILNTDVTDLLYNWSNGANTPDVDSLLPGVYTVTVSTNNGCTVENSFEIIQENLPPLAYQSTPSCNDDNGTIALQLDTTQVVAYNWSNGENEATIGGLSAGDYTVTVTYADGCTQRLETTLPLPDTTLSVSISATDTLIDLGESTTLYVEANYSDFLLEYNWSTDSCTYCPSIEVFPTTSTTYSVTVSSLADDCVETVTLGIVVLPTQSVFIPNAFTPNNDGINDRHLIFSDAAVEEVLSYSIYNRWGGLMYEERHVIPDQMQGWDGRYEGRDAENGVYVCMVEIRTIDGRQVVLSQDLTLMR